jgi:EAL domain-containing protein (putative c-di-GMP-specific phosphodiesterase class I)
MEALVRWKKSDGQLVSPGEFIPVAEDSGLVVNIGECVLRQACDFIKRARDTIPVMSLSSVSINLSSQEIDRPMLIESIHKTVQEIGIDPKWIEFEMTESSVIKDVNRAIGMITRLRSIGFGVSIDDFGTGYSSLNYLAKFPINVLKMDRSFVIDLPSNAKSKAVAKAIVSMAHDLGIKIVAEGVENEEQLAFLQFIGCDEIQGYIFSKPLPETGMRELLLLNKAFLTRQNKASI